MLLSAWLTPRDWLRGVIFWSQISNPRHYMSVFVASQDTPVRRVWPGTARILKMHRSQTKVHHSHAQSVEQGTMRQTPTNPHRTHRPMPMKFGQQFSLDAYQHGSYSLAGGKYCDLFTDLDSRHVYPIFSKTRTSILSGQNATSTSR